MSKSIQSRQMTGLCAAIFVCFLSACSAMAGPAEETISKTVGYSDLNLSSPDGAKALYVRIRGAARLVCRRSIDSLPEYREAAHVCIEKSIDDAVKHVNAPLLSQLRFGYSDSLRLAQK